MDNQYNYTEPENMNQGMYAPNFIVEGEGVENIVPKKKRKGGGNKFFKKMLAIISLAVLFGAISGGTFLGVAYYGSDILGIETASTTETQIQATVVTSDSSTSKSSSTSDVATVASDVMPSIVSITNLSVQEVADFFGQSSTYESESVGSGIIVSETDTELLILTNNHVIEDNDTITVTFVNEDSVEAVVKGADADQDLAILAINLENISSDTLNAIKIATLGDSDSLLVGEDVIAIGNALGYGQSVTTGVVSAVDRTIDGIDSTLIQTDAAINPGNSGGALLNSNGEVIGINTAKVDYDAVEGMGYAIPISEAMDTINELMNMETREVVDEENRGYIGIQGVSVTEDTATMYSMPIGVYIAEITEGGAAEAAGLTKSSIITAIDGYEVQTIEELIEVLSYYEIGEQVILTVQEVEAGGSYSEREVQLILRGYIE